MVDWKHIDSQKGVKVILDRVKLRVIPLACDAVARTVKSPFWDVVDEEAPPPNIGWLQFSGGSGPGSGIALGFSGGRR